MRWNMSSDPRQRTAVSGGDADNAFAAHMSSLPDNDESSSRRDKKWLDEYVPDEDDKKKSEPDRKDPGEAAPKSPE
jgi:hypothetical protein